MRHAFGLSNLMTKQLLAEIEKHRVAARLALVRRISDRTQDDFATAAGITRTAYTSYETGAKLPSIEAATRLCETYELTLDYIFHGEMSGLRKRTIDAIVALQRAN